MPKKIAVTGGIGSGKSTVCDMLCRMGYPVFSCDKIYKEILQDSAYIEGVRQLFPPAVTKNGIDTAILGNIVFADKEQRKKLNALAHPLVMRKLHAQMNEVKGELVFAEVPLLFEGNFQDQFDGILVIYREQSERIQAIVQRDGIDPIQAKNRIASQFDYDTQTSQSAIKTSGAIVIENKGDIKELENTLKKIIRETIIVKH